MTDFEELQLIVLTHDIPEHGLRAGDVGTVVDVPAPGALIVEFIEASGDTIALLDLTIEDVRSQKPNEMLTVRSGDAV